MITGKTLSVFMMVLIILVSISITLLIEVLK